MSARAIRRPALLRRARPLFWLWLLALILLMRPEAGPRWVHAQRPSAAAVRAPNILILVGDDHAGGTLGIDGDPRGATPRLDALAKRGVRFERAFCNAPVCTPSRQSFITGRLPHAVGVTRLATPLPDDSVTLGSWLHDLGYDTAAFGKMHFNNTSHHGFTERVDIREWKSGLKAHPPESGFPLRPWKPLRDPAAVWLNAECRSTGLPTSAMDSTFFADHAIEFIRRPRERPFLAVVGFYAPHSPFHFPREWQDRYRPEQFSVPPVTAADRGEQPLVFAPLTSADVRGIQAAYFSSLSFMDHQVGRVLDALDSAGLAEDTIVVYLSDNGYMLGQHGRLEKHCLYEPAVRVPWIVRWKGRLPEDRNVTEMVELVDLVPTLLGLVGLPSPPELQGNDLGPLLRGEPSAAGREVVFSEYLENEEAMARSMRYKLIVGTGRRIRQDGYISARPLPGPYERLFDLQSDPDETVDLAGRPELAAEQTRLRRALLERLVTTRDDANAVPPSLSEIEAIHWCLVPRDRPRR